jgi:hypothetical protein
VNFKPSFGAGVAVSVTCANVNPDKINENAKKKCFIVF